MSTGFETQATQTEELSALVDGELHSGAVAGACARWRSDSASRATWHAYQLIGDVLRSEDLASEPSRDAAFLAALRGRLAAEPVVLAPQRVVDQAEAASVTATFGGAARRRRWTWAAPAAVAAGFVAVAGVLVVMRSPGTLPAPVGAELAGATSTQGIISPQVVAVTAAPVVEPQSLVATGQVIRDAGLDRYLAAHKHFAGSAALGVPSAFLRSATVDAGGR